MHGEDFFIHAFMYLSAAVVAVLLAKRLGMGSVLGYLIAGIIMGPFVLHLIGEEGKDIMNYAEFGVEFKVCGMVMGEYGYRPQDLYPFVEIVPSAITELVHWQNQGYGLITPTVMERRQSIEEMR